MSRGRRVLALGAWVAFLSACVTGLHAVGGGLAPPPLSEPAALGPWLRGREPAEAALAGARLVALALAWYLLAATVAGVGARASGAGAPARVADALSVGVVRRLVHGAVGLSIVTSAVGGGAGAAVADPAAAPQVGVERLRLLPGGDPAPPPRLRLLPAPGTGEAAAAGEEAAADADGPRAVRVWTVRPGDHLWALAEQVLAEAWGRAPSDREVDPYWRAVVEANRARLRDPVNPDLVFPGQELVVPPPPA